MKNKVALMVVFAAIIGVWMPAVSLVASVLVLGVIFSLKYRLNILLGVISALLVYVTSGVVSMHLSYVVSGRFDLNLIYLSLSLLVAVYVHFNRVDLRAVGMSVRDVVHSLVMASVFIFLSIPLFGASDSKTLEFLHLGGEDNSSQFQMYHHVVKESTFAYGNSQSDSGIRQTLTSYPQGSHAALTLMTAPFIRDTDDVTELLRKYALGFSLLYSIFIYLVFVVCMLPLRNLKNKSTLLLCEIILGTGVLVFLGLGIFLDLFIFGFFGHITAYIGLMTVLFWVFIGFAADRKKTDYGFSELLFILLGFFLLYSSWYILAPIAVIPIVAYGILKYKAMLEKYLLALALLSIPVLLCAYLTYIYLFTSTSSGHILTPGGVVKLEPWWLFVVIPSAVLGVINFKKREWFNLTLAIGVVAAAVFTSLIGLYHLKKLGHLDYYFYKTTYTVLLMAVILFVVSLTASLRPGLEKIKRVDVTVSIAVISLCLFTVGLLVNTSSTTKAYYDSKYMLVQRDSNRVLDILLEGKNDMHQEDEIFIGACDPYINYLGTIWSGSFNLSYLKDRHKLEVKLLSATDAHLIEKLDEYASLSTVPLEVHIIGDCNKDLVQYVEQDSRFTVLFSKTLKY